MLIIQKQRHRKASGRSNKYRYLYDILLLVAKKNYSVRGSYGRNFKVRLEVVPGKGLYITWAENLLEECRKPHRS